MFFIYGLKRLKQKVANFLTKCNTILKTCFPSVNKKFFLNSFLSWFLKSGALICLNSVLQHKVTDNLPGQWIAQKI